MSSTDSESEGQNHHKPGPKDDQVQNVSSDIKALIDAFRQEQQVNRDQEGREDRGKATREKLTLGFVIITAVILLGQAMILHSSDETFKNTMIAASRAWLSPELAELDGGLPIAARPFGYYVKYGNVGKEPALDFAAQEDVDVVDDPKGQSWYSVFKRGALKDVCARTHAASPNEGGVVYPSGSQQYTYAFSSADFKITPEILSGAKRIYVHGCFAYRTFGAEHKSEYCFIFVPTPNPALLVSAHCPYGNTAN